MNSKIKTHKCALCEKQVSEFEALRFKDKKWYCQKCYSEKVNRDWFATQVCIIFGIKRPGERLYSDRKRLQETYGYTDNVIIDTLKYAIEEKHITPNTVSLGLVTPALVDEMTKLKRQLRKEAEIASNLIVFDECNLKQAPKIIVKFNDEDHPIRSNIKIKSNWDDLLGDDDYE